ncbi:MAG: glycoside hydrolase family 3 C-terminal domain-containing protein [Chloroflexota bacterium]
MSANIEHLLQQLTLEEKIRLLAGADNWHTHPVERLGIPSLKVSDGPNGVRGAWGSLATPSACTPVGTALAATWNTGLVEQIGRLLGEETRAKGADVLLAPTVNLHRTPVAGRNFECFSEDPCLTAEMAAAYIRGVQSQGVGCCIKHFVCNDQEYQRFSISAEVEERPLRELYLEPFRKAIRDAQPVALMTAYNRICGVYASQHDYLIKTLLKGEWGYDGLVMSDWGGTYSDAVPAGGLDLEMPGPARWMSANLVRKALAEGSLTAEELDDKVRRLLGALLRTGRFDHPYHPPEGMLDTPDQRQLLRRAAREAIVLLKNEGVLPLRGIRRLAVIGANARWPEIMGGGSSTVIPYDAVSPLQGIRQRAGNSVEVEYAIGAFSGRYPPYPQVETMQTADGQPGWLLEIFDSPDLRGEPLHRRLIRRTNVFFGDIPEDGFTQRALSARLSGWFIPQESGLHTFWLEATGETDLIINGEQVIEIRSGLAQSLTRQAPFHLTAGQSYRIEITCRAASRQPAGWLRLGCLPPHPADLLGEAEALAARSDAAIVVAGLTADWESEGFDRLDMRLPGEQDELIRRVAAVNPNTVVVLNSGSPVEMPWLEGVNALVQLWYTGQEQGNALADILFGDVAPSGKLPTTFPRRLEDNPAFINYPGENGKVLYGEGLFIGYRYYDYTQREVLFPFGHGLSYTIFEYDDLQITPSEFRDDETVEVAFRITNRGGMPGMETAQIYVRDVHCRLTRPPKELKGFVKVELQPGESQTVRVRLNREAFWFYNPAKPGWETESGLFEILIGASSRDIRLSGTVRLLPAAGQADRRWGVHSRLGEVLADEQAAAILRRYFGSQVDSPQVQSLLELTLEDIAARFPQLAPPALLSAVEEELGNLVN